MRPCREVKPNRLVLLRHALGRRRAHARSPLACRSIIPPRSAAVGKGVAPSDRERDGDGQHARDREECHGDDRGRWGKCSFHGYWCETGVTNSFNIHQIDEPLAGP